MKIVMATPAVPHPFGDTAAKWFYVLINELAEAGHQVHCLAVSEEPEKLVEDAQKRLREKHPGNNLHFRFHRMVPDRNILRRKMHSALRPFSEMMYANGFYESLKRELHKGYDVLHLEQLWTGWLGSDLPRSLLNIHHFEIIDWEDRKLTTLREKKALTQMTRATKKILRSSRNLRMFTPRLQDKAKAINPNGKYWVVPFALDLSLYSLQPFVEEPVVGLLGSMHWNPSRSAAERLLTRIWPEINRRMPAARLMIAGWNAQKYLGKFMPMKNVQLEENLKHPTDFFSRAAVMVYAPSKGSGMKIKVLESMAYGTPVVTTWEGVEGVEYANGGHCWVEEDDLEIANKVLRLLENREERKSMRMTARGLMEEKYSPGPVVERMLGIYEEIGGER